MPLWNISLFQPQCGCDLSNSTANRTCDCCITRQQEDDAYLNNATCNAGEEGKSNCTCLYNAAGNLTCDCNHTSNVRYLNITVPEEKCNCLDTGRNGTKLCKCCMTLSVYPQPVIECPNTFDP